MLTVARHAIRSAFAAAVTATHVHYDPLDRLVGGYRYEICSCGARRAREVIPGLGRPLLPGWDQLVTTGRAPRWTSADAVVVKLIENREHVSNPWRARR